MSKSCVSFAILFLKFAIVCFCQGNSPKKMNFRMDESLSFFVNDKDLKNASIGFIAQKVKTGEIISQINPDLSLNPASSMKVITTAAALQILGKKHQFITTLQYDGNIENGILEGNIYIKGGGNPTLGSSLFCEDESRMLFLKKWKQAIIELGIVKIDGAVIADDNIFPSDIVPQTWTWGDIGNYYGAGACGLSIFDNNYEIEFETGLKPGDSTKIKNIWPRIPYLQLNNYVLSSDYSGDNSSIYGAPNSGYQEIKGTLPIGQKAFKVRGAIPNPALLAAILLDESLREINIDISKNPSVISNNINQKSRIDFYLDMSPTLDSIVYWTNMKSINSYAESLLNHIGLKLKNKGETYSGTIALKEYWQDKGMDINGLFLADGSGLSRANGITVKQINYVLNDIYKSPEFDSFYKSLPVAGKSGSISNVCKGSLAENNLRAKSGYMSRVRSYAGYVKNRKGELIAFSIIVNNYNCSPTVMKQKIEKLFISLAETD